MDDHDAPATKGDLVELDAPMTERDEQLRCEMSHGYGNVVKRISDSEDAPAPSVLFVRGN